MSILAKLKRLVSGEDGDSIHAKVRRATVAFGIMDSDGNYRISGSGVLVHPSGVILTAAHVMQGLGEQLQTLKAKGKKVGLPGHHMRVMVTARTEAEHDEKSAEVTAGADLLFPLIEEYKHNKNKDLAIVRVDMSGFDHPVETLPINSDTVIHGGRGVAACGYPYGLDPHEGKSVLNTFLRGHVSGVAPIPDIPPTSVSHYLLQMPVNPGNSGGPVFDPETAEVLAVVSRRYQTGQIPSGLAVAVPVHGLDGQVKEAARRA